MAAPVVRLFGAELDLFYDAGLREAGKLWPVTHVLAAFLQTEAWFTGGRAVHVVELGAGTGALGIGLQLALPMATVVLTDLPCVLPLVRLNIERCCGAGAAWPQARALCWGEAWGETADVRERWPEVVLACECLYWPAASLLEDDTRALLRCTLSAFAARGATVYLAFTVRDAARELGFAAELAGALCSEVRYAPGSALVHSAGEGDVVVIALQPQAQAQARPAAAP